MRMSDRAPLSLADVLDQFRRALRAAGLDTDAELVADGTLHRFRVQGDKAGTRNGFYVLHADGLPAAEFGSWKTGQRETWRADIGRTCTADEERTHRERVAAMRVQRAEDEKRQRAATAARAENLWNKASELVRADHPYLVAKRVRAFGLRQLGPSLVVPLQRDGALVGLQFIGADSSKRFLTGTPKSGAWHLIGEADSAPTIAIAEGYATAATVHGLSGWPVAVAFDAGNLLAVAKALRRRNPAAELILAADDDRSTPGNPGLSKARQAAEAVGGLVCVPPFEPTDEGTDWNDYALALARSSRVAEVQ